jgi:hypothetical protein
MSRLHYRTPGNTLTGVPNLQISCSPPVQQGARAGPHWARLHTPALAAQGHCLEAGEGTQACFRLLRPPDRPPSSAPLTAMTAGTGGPAVTLLLLHLQRPLPSA